jgi:hypothetical protein
MGLAEPTVTKLLAILEREGSPELMKGVLKQITKRKNQAASDIQQGDSICKTKTYIFKIAISNRVTPHRRKY